MNQLFGLLLLFTLVACNPKSSSPAPLDSSVTSVSNDVDDYTHGSDDVPNEAYTWNENLDLINFLAADELKVQEAADLLKKVIASKEFKDAVINHTYNGQKTFVDNGGLTNLQVYNTILAGSEKLSPARNNALDVEIELYSEDTNTIGYTYPTSPRIWMNTKYFNQYTPFEVCDNLMHEWLHKLGFGHSATYNAARPYSVPYAIGYLVESLSHNFKLP